MVSTQAENPTVDSNGYPIRLTPDSLPHGLPGCSAFLPPGHPTATAWYRPQVPRQDQRFPLPSFDTFNAANQVDKNVPYGQTGSTYPDPHSVMRRPITYPMYAARQREAQIGPIHQQDSFGRGSLLTAPCVPHPIPSQFSERAQDEFVWCTESFQPLQSPLRRATTPEPLDRRSPSPEIKIEEDSNSEMSLSSIPHYQGEPPRTPRNDRISPSHGDEEPQNQEEPRGDADKRRQRKRSAYEAQLKTACDALRYLSRIVEEEQRKGKKKLSEALAAECKDTMRKINDLTEMVEKHTHPENPLPSPPTSASTPESDAESGADSSYSVSPLTTRPRAKKRDARKTLALRRAGIKTPRDMPLSPRRRYNLRSAAERSEAPEDYQWGDGLILPQVREMAFLDHVPACSFFMDFNRVVW